MSDYQFGILVSGPSGVLLRTSIRGWSREEGKLQFWLLSTAHNLPRQTDRRKSSLTPSDSAVVAMLVLWKEGTRNWISHLHSKLLRQQQDWGNYRWFGERQGRVVWCSGKNVGLLLGWPRFKSSFLGKAVPNSSRAKVWTPLHRARHLGLINTPLVCAKTEMNWSCPARGQRAVKCTQNPTTSLSEGGDVDTSLKAFATIKGPASTYCRISSHQLPAPSRKHCTRFQRM